MAAGGAYPLCSRRDWWSNNCQPCRTQALQIIKRRGPEWTAQSRHAPGSLVHSAPRPRSTLERGANPQRRDRGTDLRDGQLMATGKVALGATQAERTLALVVVHPCQRALGGRRDRPERHELRPPPRPRDTPGDSAPDSPPVADLAAVGSTSP